MLCKIKRHYLYLNHKTKSCTKLKRFIIKQQCVVKRATFVKICDFYVYCIRQHGHLTSKWIPQTSKFFSLNTKPENNNFFSYTKSFKYTGAYRHNCYSLARRNDRDKSGAPSKIFFMLNIIIRRQSVDACCTVSLKRLEHIR